MVHVFIDTETSGFYPIVHRVVCIGYMREGEVGSIRTKGYGTTRRGVLET